MLLPHPQNRAEVQDSARSAAGQKGRHTDKGEYTVEDWLKIYADHLEGHARQIDRNVDAWQKGGGRPSADA